MTNAINPALPAISAAIAADFANANADIEVYDAEDNGSCTVIITSPSGASLGFNGPSAEEFSSDVSNEARYTAAVIAWALTTENAFESNELKDTDVAPAPVATRYLKKAGVTKPDTTDDIYDTGDGGYDSKAWAADSDAYENLHAQVVDMLASAALPAMSKHSICKV